MPKPRYTYEELSNLRRAIDSKTFSDIKRPITPPVFTLFQARFYRTLGNTDEGLPQFDGVYLLDPMQTDDKGDREATNSGFKVKYSRGKHIKQVRRLAQMTRLSNFSGRYRRAQINGRVVSGSAGEFFFNEYDNPDVEYSGSLTYVVYNPVVTPDPSDKRKLGPTLNKGGYRLDWDGRGQTKIILAFAFQTASKNSFVFDKRKPRK